eukprot:6199596-Pleurochrysis_carterae.AAC.2
MTESTPSALFAIFAPRPFRFSQEVDSFYDRLEVGSVFLISGGTLKPSNVAFNKTGHAFEITLNRGSTVRLRTRAATSCAALLRARTRGAALAQPVFAYTQRARVLARVRIPQSRSCPQLTKRPVQRVQHFALTPVHA